MPRSWSCFVVSEILERLEATSKPPSVVSSSRFSGTRQTEAGSSLIAMSTISEVFAISKFNGIFRASLRLQMSLSRI